MFEVLPCRILGRTAKNYFISQDREQKIHFKLVGSKVLCTSGTIS